EGPRLRRSQAATRAACAGPDRRAIPEGIAQQKRFLSAFRAAYVPRARGRPRALFLSTPGHAAADPTTSMLFFSPPIFQACNPRRKPPWRSFAIRRTFLRL